MMLEKPFPSMCTLHSDIPSRSSLSIPWDSTTRTPLWSTDIDRRLQRVGYFSPMDDVDTFVACSSSLCMHTAGDEEEFVYRMGVP